MEDSLKLKVAEFGFKKISLENWLQPDPIYNNFVKVSPNDKVEPMKGDEYVAPLLKPKLLEAVPHDVQALFEVARGAMIYGYFFYPLWTLGSEQLFRVVETAVSQKCKDHGHLQLKISFKNKINWLEHEKVISPIDKETLHNIREMRNLASHPTDQSIITPGIAISLLESIAMAIKALSQK